VTLGGACSSNSTDTSANTAPKSSSLCAASTIFGAEVPTIPVANDQKSVELGVKFRSAQSGTISAIRFYRGVDSPSGFKVHLYSASGKRLATATVPSGQPGIPGWIEATLPSPVAIAADKTYVASYFTPVGQYGQQVGGLISAVTQWPLTALASGTSGGNGVYAYGSGRFPKST
jgi:hypothetical protein